jgi:rhodanese-related sulfurtransferase
MTTPPYTLIEFTPQAVHPMVRDRSVVLIDVREPHEYLSERIRGALLFPMSTFDPASLPSPKGCEIVFHCGSGKRSAMAVEQCLKAGVGHASHMAGGIQAWKAAGLPTVAVEPGTGRLVERP